MFLKYLSLLCLGTSSIFATSFDFNVTCLINNSKRVMQFEIDESTPYQTKSEDLNFRFAILKHTDEIIAVQTIITCESKENNESTIVAQPILVVAFNKLATLSHTANNGKKDFELTLIVSKKNN